MLPARIVYPAHKIVKHRAGRRHHQRRRHRANRDPVLIHLLRQPLREPLQRRLLSPIARPPAIRRRVRIRPPPRPYRRPRRYVHDAPATARHHILQNQLAEDKRRVKVHRPRAHPPVQRVIFHRDEIGKRRIIDQYIHRPIRIPRRLHQRLAILRQRYVRRRRHSLAPRRAYLSDSRVQRTLQRMAALLHRPRRAHHLPTLRREQYRYVLANPPARPRHDDYLAVKSAHQSPPVFPLVVIR